MHIYVFIFFDSNLEDKIFRTELKKEFLKFYLLLISSQIKF
jgi:hypothetical protein